MKTIPQYNFHKTKYGNELLIDVVPLKDIKRFLKDASTHTITYYDITLVCVGKGAFRINDQLYNVQPDDVIFSMPGDIRYWDIASISSGYALIFEEEFLLSFFNDRDFLGKLSYFHPDRNTYQMTLTGKMIERVSALIHNIKEEIDNYQKKDEHILRALLYEVLMLLNREYQTESQAPVIKMYNRYVSDFVKLVNKEFIVHHDTKYYADKLCVTPGYLNELVSDSLGISAKLYIKSQLLIEAKKLLLYSDLSIVQIAEKLNFSSDSYFVRFFRQQANQTPLQYRTLKKE